jgi:predicted nucleic acid-binding protein
MVVIDTSVVASWCFPDESDPVAATAFSLVATAQFTVPMLFWFELRNVLLVGERRGRLVEANITDFLGFLSDIRIEEDRTPHEAQIFSFARRYKLTIYDAAYLELAHRKNVALATLDHALIKAAKAEKIALLAAAKSQLP